MCQWLGLPLDEEQQFAHPEAGTSKVPGDET